MSMNINGHGSCIAKSQHFLVFRRDGLDAQNATLDGNREFLLWRPSPLRLYPPTLRWKHSLWWLAHYGRIFRNRDYATLLIVNGNTVVHRTCVVPACFRWPFMDDADLQISSTWTAPECRGQSLATMAVRRMVFLFRRPGRHFWYITRAGNAASVAVCRKAGFSLVGTAKRTRRLGLRLLGAFEIDSNTGGDEGTRAVA
jgi:RimJ/RimL family protein N-acetyltransferase